MSNFSKAYRKFTVARADYDRLIKLSKSPRISESFKLACRVEAKLVAPKVESIRLAAVALHETEEQFRARTS